MKTNNPPHYQRKMFYSLSARVFLFIVTYHSICAPSPSLAAFLYPREKYNLINHEWNSNGPMAEGRHRIKYGQTIIGNSVQEMEVDALSSSIDNHEYLELRNNELTSKGEYDASFLQVQ